MKRTLIAGSLCLLFTLTATAAPGDWTTAPSAGAYGDWPKAAAAATVVLEPEKDEAEYWMGAPSVVRDASGTFWMACRMRAPDRPRGERGHTLRLLRSSDGEHFEDVQRITRDQLPLPGFERPALLIDPATKQFKLYGCGAWNDGPWSIFKFDDADAPGQFDPKTARVVIAPLPVQGDRDVLPVEYKDPVVVHDGARYHCFVIGYMRKNERLYHFESSDGETWKPAGNPYISLLPLSGWHDFFVRPASAVRTGLGWLFFYEGSHTAWHDPVYNIGTGLAYSFDLGTLQDLTPDAPLWISPTPGPQCAAFRYASALWVDHALWVYAEVARPNDAHDIRLIKLPPVQ